MKKMYILKSFIGLTIFLLVSNSYAQILVPDTYETRSESSFQPIPGEKYIISAWVKEDHAEQQISYRKSRLDLLFVTSLNDTVQQTTVKSFRPSGKIINGWQQITAEFKIPVSTEAIRIEMVAEDSAIDCYFDDIRFYPFNGNLKSFVYDNQTQRLLAELDENNYATFYEYDKEGGLIRVKKETEKGIFTIQETRSGNSKISGNN